MNGNESSTLATIFSSNMWKAFFDILCQTPLIAIPTGKCFQTNQDNLQTEAFKSIQGWKMDRFKGFSLFCWKVAGCFVYFSPKIQSFTKGFGFFAATKLSNDALWEGWSSSSGQPGPSTFKIPMFGPGTLGMLAIEALQAYICSPIWRTWTDWWAKTQWLFKFRRF